MPMGDNVVLKVGSNLSQGHQSSGGLTETDLTNPLDTMAISPEGLQYE